MKLLFAPKVRRQRSLSSLIRIIGVLVVVAASCFGGVAHAHTTGETYVWLNIEEENITGRVEVNLDELREKLGLRVPESGESRDVAISDSQSQVLDYIREHFEIRVAGDLLPIQYTSVTILDLPVDEGSYAQYHYVTPKGRVPDLVTIRNTLFVEGDFTHRSLVCVERNRKSGQEFEGEFTAMVFGSHNPVQEFDLTHIDLLLRPRDFVWQGVLHIWIGLDHILFIVALLLPAVLVFSPKVTPSSDEGQPELSGDQESTQLASQDTNGVLQKHSTWTPSPNIRSAFFSIIRIVTIFTVAHSITLSLAALGIVQMPSRLVESMIAFSIVLVAWNTITQRFQGGTWLVIFGFGLFHGMGFASVMSELPFRMLHLVRILIGFNVGVELGQLAIVAVLFPILFLLRKTRFYVPVVLNGGSAIIGVIAAYWFIERAFKL